jgi:hypothetical protein
MLTKFWSGNLKGRVHLEDLGVDGSILLKWIVKKFDGRTRPTFIWIRIGNNGGLL